MPIKNQPQYYFGPTGASLEQLVLTNSSQYFNSNKPPNTARDKWRTAAVKIGNSQEKAAEDEFADEGAGCCDKKVCFWSPAQNSIPVEFCNETSIHGLQFMGQAKRHITERVFWLIAFLLSFSAAIYLIYEVWDRYNRIPVIVSFQAVEQDIDSIPFPAVTLCDMNKFPKKKVQELYQITRNLSDPNRNTALIQLTFVRSVCNAQQSFAKEFGFAAGRGEEEADTSQNDTIPEDSQDEMMDFLLENTISCDDLIRLCMFGEKVRNCSELFSPVITDYGKCCTFNILPLPLLLKNPQEQNASNIYNNPVLGNKPQKNWPMEEIKLWENWTYDEGFVLPENISRPFRQKRAGMPYGLSILLDPNIDDYYCPVSDSEGVRFILHTSLEMPHVMEFASVADLGKEILIEVHPDVTNADDDIRDIDRAKRKCFFGKERSLRFFGPYTGGNCIDECTAIVLGSQCNCTYFYMPRDDGVKICNNDPDSADNKCIEAARVDLQDTLKDKCGHCDALCEDITYNYETTIVQLQNAGSLWLDPDRTRNKSIPHWALHKMSVVHIFFGSETTVPKLRKRLYGTTDLIANTGGILGLCLGVSVLSGVEVIYFLTLRSFWKFCRKRMIGRRVANKFFRAKNERMIHMNPNRIPIYPSQRGGGGVNGQFYNGNLQYAAGMYSRTPYGGNLGYY